MAKIRKTYVCTYCGKDIEFGDDEAVEYDGEIYCDEDCLIKDLSVDYVVWGR